MTEEQAAVAILDRAIKDGAATMGKRHAVAMKAMLGEPRLPKEMDNAIRSILACGGVVEPEVSWQRLREHLSKPRTKTVEIWRVEWAVKDPLSSWQPVVAHYTTELAAQEQARLIQRLSDVRCICVTGPHAQEVPE